MLDNITFKSKQCLCGKWRNVYGMKSLDKFPDSTRFIHGETMNPRQSLRYLQKCQYWVESLIKRFTIYYKTGFGRIRLGRLRM